MQPKLSEITVTLGNPTVIRTPTTEFRLFPSSYLQASILNNGAGVSLDDPGKTSANSLLSDGKIIDDFTLDLAHARVSEASGRMGNRGKRIEIAGHSASLPGIVQTLSIEVYDNLPGMALTSTSYRNTGSSLLTFNHAITQHHQLNASLSDPAAHPYSMWSFHGSSEAWGKNDVMPIDAKFRRSNTMQVIEHNDENQTGGGIPVVAFWTGSVGEVIGQAEVVPLKMSLPVQTDADGTVSASIVTEGAINLRPGDVYTTPLTFVAVFHGDFYQALSTYSKMLRLEGLSFAHTEAADYQPNWCGWGYELGVTPKQMVDTIPKLKELGFKWATLDAGWFDKRGDWQPKQSTFPDHSIENVTKAYHDAGIHITLWWIPLVVEDGIGKDILDNRLYQTANVVKEHPDWLILDKDGEPARATANLGALCPAVPEVQRYYKQLTEKFIRDWGFDGHKLDFAYTVPACYNPKHHHKSPEDSIAAVADIYKIIHDTTRALKPESVMQACPCGTPPNLAWLPQIDQAVTADPVGSQHVRLRTKMYKALLGPDAAVYGDHVELTDVRFANTTHEMDMGRDFASTIGTGAVVGTKFTWPNYGSKFKAVELTAEKELIWKKWLAIYNSKMLSQGNFLGLYTYGYDWPEAYAIEKDGHIFYAFYADKAKPFTGTIELRGLRAGKYRVVNYETGESLGDIDAANSRLKANFREHLLLECAPL